MRFFYKENFIIYVSYLTTCNCVLPLNSALAVETDVKKDCKYGDSVISESTLNEKEKEQFNNEKADYMDLSLEIANSDLEERAIISSQNGHVKNAETVDTKQINFNFNYLGKAFYRSP